MARIGAAAYAAVFVALVCALGAEAGSQIGDKCTEKTERFDCGLELVCREGRCSGCVENNECSGWNRVCDFESPDEDGNFYCEHKNLFPNFNIFDAISSVLVFLGAALAASGGVGGGGIFVPIMVIVGDFAARYAAPLSDVMITCGAIVNFILFFPKTLEDGKTPLIDFDVALVFEPMILCGTIVGVICNGSFPEWLIVVCFIIVLTSATWRTAKKGWAVWKLESAEAKKAKAGTAKYTATVVGGRGVPVGLDSESNGTESYEGADDPRVAWVSVNKDVDDTTREGRASSADAHDEAPTLADVHSPGADFTRRTSTTHRPSYVGSEQYELSLLENDELSTGVTGGSSTAAPARESIVDASQSLSFSETLVPSKLQALNMIRGIFCLPYRHTTKAEAATHQRMVPWDKIFLVLCIWVAFLFVNLFRGGKSGSASMFGIEKCSPIFWTATAVVIPVATVVTLLIAIKVAKDNNACDRLGIETPEGHIQWGKHGNIIRYPIICFMSGVMAGLLGIGGGMIVGPLLLEIGVHPQRAAATTSFTVLFTSTATVVQRVMAKTLKYDYGAWMGMCSFLGSLIGQLWVSYIVKKYRKTALIIFCLGSGIGLATVLMGVNGIISIVQTVSHGGYMGFRSYCET